MKDRRYGRLHYLFKDLAGQRFGQLVVLHLCDYKVRGRVGWRCRCDCGVEKDFPTTFLTCKMAVSCGCYGRSIRGKASITHGRTGTPEHRTWAQMIQRCCNEKNPSYRGYGARGITVCQRWRNSFEAFLDDMGERKSLACSIERIDNFGNYEPGNCRWATDSEQARNRRSSRLLTLNGETKTVAEWVEITGIPSTTIRARIDDRGWSVEKALTVAVGEGGRQGKRFLEFNGETKTITEWSKITGICRNTILSRIDLHGWSVERALTTPVHRKHT